MLDAITFQEISMKNMTKAFVVGGLMVLAQAAVANVSFAASAFPGAAEDGIIGLPAKSTFADRHLDKPTRISQPNQDSGISGN
jgi:hypothetical protein